MTLPFLALGLAVIFFVLLRLGVLDQLPELFGRPSRRRSDPEEERRLEVFRDFIEGDPKSEE